MNDVEEIISKYNKSKSNNEKITLLKDIISIYGKNFNYLQAIKYSLEYFKLVDTDKNLKREKWFLFKLTSFYFYIGNYDEALTLLFKEKEFSKNSPEDNAYIYFKIGVIYKEIERYAEAINYLKKALEITEKYNLSLERKLSIYNTLGNSFRKTHQYKNAFKYYLEGLFLAEENNMKKTASAFNNNLALAYTEVKKFDIAKEHIKKAIKFHTENGNKHKLANSLETAGRIYLSAGEYENAEKILNNALQLLDEETDIKLKINILSLMSELLEKQQRYKDAFHFLKELIKLKETYFLEEKRLKIIETETRMHFLELFNENETIKDKNKELIALYEKLREQNKNLEEINNNLKTTIEYKDYIVNLISHDLNNALTVVTNGLSLLAMKNNLSDNKYFGMINAAIENVKTILATILLSNKLEWGKLEINPTITDLKKYIEEYSKIAQVLCEQKNITYQFEASDDEYLAKIDKGKFIQILQNLITNAVKFTNSGGFIKTSLEKDKDYVIIKVSDTGIGIDEEEKLHLFEKFTPIRKRGTAGESTNGIGLYIVKKLVEMHNGIISVESEKNKGTTFIIKLKKADL